MQRNIFSEFKLKKLIFKNRIIFPAISTKMVEDGKVTDRLIDYHITRVKGGTSLNIIEATSVHEGSAPKEYLKLTEDKYIEGISKLVDEIHKNGGKAGIQLVQSGIYDPEGNREIIVPSDYELDNGKILKKASQKKIKEIVEDFGRASKRAEEAGVDLIQLNIGNSDSSHLFLSSHYNKREDQYGGDLKSRMKYILEIIKEVRKSVSKDMVISLKIISQDDYLDQGLTNKDIIEVINLLEDHGIDLVEISRGNIHTDAVKYQVPILGVRADYNLENLRNIRENIKLPIVYGGAVTSREGLDLLLGEELCQLVAVGRGQLADPYFVDKLEKNLDREIVKCMRCNQGCYDGFLDSLTNSITCVRNPKLGMERRFKEEKDLAQKVAVVGGGLGGIESSIFLKERGHEPILFEKGDQLGGQLLSLLNSPIAKKLKPYLENRIKYLKSLGVKVNLNTEFTSQMVVDGNFDSVVISTGARPKTLNIPGGDKENIYNYEDILLKHKPMSGRVVVLGSSSMAHNLISYIQENYKGLDLVVLEEKTAYKNMGKARKVVFKNLLEDEKIPIKTDLEFLEVKEDRIVYRDKNKKKSLKMDYIVIATGSDSNKSNDIKQFCQDREIPFYVIGDALIPRKTLDVISEAANIAYFEIN